VGARVLLLTGMTLTLTCNVVFGAAASYWTLVIFMGVNGLAQATGWPGGIGTMAQWTTRGDRGTIMGLWATCYLVGGVLANGLATLMRWWLGWRWSFFGGAIAMGLILIVFFALQRNCPEDVGLPALHDSEEPGGGWDGAPPVRSGPPRHGLLARLGWDGGVLATLFLVGSFYFCIKFIRYALWSWAPYFLELNFGLEGHQSGLLATVFDASGFFGVVSAGVASDRLFRGRRSVVAFLMLAGLLVGCLVLFLLGSRSVTLFGVGLGVVGFMLYGPDSLLSGAGAIDIGGRRGAIISAGVINGMGAIGSIVQELVIGNLYARTGGDLRPIFSILLGSSALALVFVGIIIARNRAGRSDL
jgi:sugar phosphate permease